MGFTSDRRALWRWTVTSGRVYLWQSFKPKYLGLWLVALIVAAGAVTISLYHDTIARAVGGYSGRIREHWWSPGVAVVVLMIWAIPPMVGHPLIVLIIGLIWGLLEGSIITILGTYLGELMVYLATRALFTNRAREFEKASPFYSSIAIVLRHGGLWPNTFVRVSFISGHITTLLQAVTGTPWYIFLLAQVPEWPSQIALVYMGVVFSQPDSKGHTFLLSALIYAATLSFSVVAAVILYKRVSEVYPRVKEDFVRRGKAIEEESECGESEEESEGETFELPRRSREEHTAEGGLQGNRGWI